MLRRQDHTLRHRSGPREDRTPILPPQSHHVALSQQSATVTGVTITYTTGDATHPADDDHIKIIAHICNDIGAWGRGFVLAISKRWTKPEESYRHWAKDRRANDFRLGSVQTVAVEDDIFVANMIAQHGIGYEPDGTPPIRYAALSTCLGELARTANYLGASVHMPRIGTGLAGGTWDLIEPIIKAQLCDYGIPVTVYDLP